jgi:hypothetical protein
MSHHLTIDVEAPEHMCRMAPADYRPGEVQRDLEEWLVFLEGLAVRSTFFVLGEVAKRAPGIVRGLVQAGHEVASHGYLHRPVHKLGEAEFREDLGRSKALLEDLLGRPVRGYRSPAWTLGLAPASYHEMVFGAGYAYSSSLLPAMGFMKSSRLPEPREFSPCVWRCGPVSIPAGTSWTFRLIPSSRLERHLEGDERHVLVAHAHELSRGRSMAGLGPGASFIRYAGTAGWREKLEGLLAPRAWGPLETLPV